VLYQPTLERRATRQISEFFPFDKAAVQSVRIAHMICMCAIPVCIALLGSSLQIAALEVTRDVEALDQVAHGVYRLHTKVPEPAGFLLAKTLFELFLRLALAQGALPAIAAGSSPGYALRLQQHHPVAAFSQVQG